MAYLFIIEDKRVFPTEETLCTPPFKDIWERDKSKDKDIAMKEFAFIEFMTSHLRSNPYKGYTEKVRFEVLCRDIMKDPKYKPDDLVKQGLKAIETFQQEASPAYQMYKDAMESERRVREALRTIDFKARTQQGSAVYKPVDAINALKGCDEVVIRMANLKKKVEEELYEAVKVKSGKVVSPFSLKESFDDIEW